MSAPVTTGRSFTNFAYAATKSVDGLPMDSTFRTLRDILLKYNMRCGVAVNQHPERKLQFVFRDIEIAND